MNAQTRKEIRAILPFFAVAVLAPVLTTPLAGFWTEDTMIGPTMFICGIVGVAMSVMTFGDEFSNRTMGLLLAQPLSRSKIWRRKMLVLGAALAICFFAVGIRIFTNLGCHLESSTFLDLGSVLFLTIGIYCTAPFWTMCVRNSLGATAATAMTPIVLVFLMDMLMEYFFQRWSWSAHFDTASLESLIIACILALYFALCYWLGREVFLHFEVTDSPGREIALPERLQPLFAPLWRALTPGHGGPLRSLITKELYLQRVSFGMAIVSCVVFFFGAASWRLCKSEWAMTTATLMMVMPFTLNFLLDFLVTGGVCVAEERNWGMLGWQLVLPPSKRLQWIVKVSVAMGTSLVLGIFVPLALYLACKSWFHLPFDLLNSDWNALLLMYPLLIATSIYTSSLTSSTMRAIIMSLALLFAGGTVFVLAVNGAELLIETTFNYRMEMFKEGDIGIFAIVAIGALIAVLVYLGFINFRAGEVSQRRKWMQPTGLVLGIGIIAFVASFLMLCQWPAN